jgi:hypothetical protein
LFSGFFLNKESIPAVAKWLQSVCSAPFSPSPLQ